jgi:hypothetical protein
LQTILSLSDSAAFAKAGRLRAECSSQLSRKTRLSK